MSSFRVLSETSLQLRSLLWNGFVSEPDIHPVIVPDENSIVFLNPTEAAKDSSHRLSLWLYRIEENEFVKNQPPQRANGTGPLKPPLALDLSYLVTPLSGHPENDLHLLGKTMQVCYENAIVDLRNEPESVFEDLRIVLGRISLEELTRIWEALSEPYRLSVCYRVRVTHVDPDQLVTIGRVESSQRGYGVVDEDTPQ